MQASGRSAGGEVGTLWTSTPMNGKCSRRCSARVPLESEPAGDEVEGFALNVDLKLKGQKQGQNLSAFDEGPKENISFNFGSVQFQYSLQHDS